MTDPKSSNRNLRDIYENYVAAILRHDLDSMDQFVSDDVVHNDQPLGLLRYKQLLLRNIIETRVHIKIKRLIVDDDHVAAVLVFTTTESTSTLVGIELDGQPFSYVEIVIYDFKDRKIAEVHSQLDIDTIRSHAR